MSTQLCVIYQQQENIPVGCVPPAYRPYPVVSHIPPPRSVDRQTEITFPKLGWRVVISQKRRKKLFATTAGFAKSLYFMDVNRGCRCHLSQSNFSRWFYRTLYRDLTILTSPVFQIGKMSVAEEILMKILNRFAVN